MFDVDSQGKGVYGKGDMCTMYFCIDGYNGANRVLRACIYAAHWFLPSRVFANRTSKVTVEQVSKITDAGNNSCNGQV